MISQAVRQGERKIICPLRFVSQMKRSDWHVWLGNSVNYPKCLTLTELSPQEGPHLSSFLPAFFYSVMEVLLPKVECFLSPEESNSCWTGFLCHDGFIWKASLIPKAGNITPISLPGLSKGLMNESLAAEVLCEACIYPLLHSFPVSCFHLPQRCLPTISAKCHPIFSTQC